jgi:hypothetical protein
MRSISGANRRLFPVRHLLRGRQAGGYQQAHPARWHDPVCGWQLPEPFEQNNRVTGLATPWPLYRRCRVAARSARPIERSTGRKHTRITKSIAK